MNLSRVSSAPKTILSGNKGDRYTAPKFRGGPQFGEEYSFHLFLQTGLSRTHRGPVLYLGPNDSTPTPTLTYTSSPTKTYTPTHTPTRAETPIESPTAAPTLPPTFTPTPTVTAIATYTPTPQPTLAPNQPPQEITIDLPGLPEGAVPLQLVWIPPGKFMMGSPEDEVGSLKNERPQHEVTISEGFYMGKYEITNAQYWIFDYKNNQELIQNDENLNLPANYISWDKAKDYCEWLTNHTEGWIFQLPNEAEWEYASRAESESRFYFGVYPSCVTSNDECSEINQFLWWKQNSSNILHPVGSKIPNAFGLFDILGNAREWCIDTYHLDYDGAPNDGSVWNSNEENSVIGMYVSRGGSYLDSINRCRNSYRFAFRSNYENKLNGFRIISKLNLNFDYSDSIIAANVTPIPTPTPTPPINIFTEENFPDPYFREMILFYILKDYAEDVLSVDPLMFTALFASQVEGSWDFANVPGVGDGDITNATGLEFFSNICRFRTNSAFHFEFGRCP